MRGIRTCIDVFRRAFCVGEGAGGGLRGYVGVWVDGLPDCEEAVDVTTRLFQ